MPRFLHIADPHIDSPVSTGFQPADLGDLHAESLTRDAFAAAVDLAIAETVSAVIVAGDLFDGDWRRGGTRQGRENAGTWQWTVRQFQKLADAAIPVAFLRGNHDAASQLAVDLKWPEGLHEFDVRSPDTFLIEDAGLAIHGQGYERREQTANVAAVYPKAVPGLFNVGVLHTGLEAAGPYAPATLDDLLGREYGYWALGHIHKPTALGDASRHGVPILYAGNPQGRNVNECGPRGCLLVDYAGGTASVTSRPLDKLRWFNETVDADGCDTEKALLNKVTDMLAERRGEAGDRAVVTRVTVSGPFEDHHKIDGFSAKSVFEQSVRERAAELDGVWVESVRVQTRPPVDLSRLVRPGDPMAEVLAQLDAAIAATSGEFDDPASVGDTLFATSPADSEPLSDVMAAIDHHAAPAAARQLGLEVTPADRRRWLEAARSHLIAELASEV